MTFEAPIERLTERHEALMQSVEMMRQDSEKYDEQIARLATISEQTLDRMDALSRIVESHERRIHNLKLGQA